MARKIITQLVDDLDGEALAHGEGETVLFSLDGIAYEIDLSSANAAALRDALSTYVDAGRRISSSKSSGGARRAASPDLAAIRTWAEANGYEVASRGRVAASVVVAYRAAH